MKFAFIADIHLSRYSQDKIESETNLPERLHSIQSALYEVAGYCADNNIKTIVIGGDILHGKSIIHAIAQDIMLQFFDDCDLEFYVIDGNHDLSGKGENVVSALRSLEKLQNVTWISFKNIYRKPDDDILFIPYSNNVSELVKKNEAKILISHYGLSEAVLNSGISIISDIKLSDLLGKYQLVLLGHYHKPQEIIKDDFKLYYSGSLIQLDWGEKDDEKRFLVVDTEELKVESIPIINYRRHIEVKVDNKNKEEAIEIARKARENGDYVKMVMVENVDLTDIKGEFNIINKTETDITNRGISSTMSQEDKLKKYIDIKEIPKDKRDMYLKTGLSIINDCEEK